MSFWDKRRVVVSGGSGFLNEIGVVSPIWEGWSGLDVQGFSGLRL